MNIKQLKADYQLAELRLKSDNSEKNQTIFKQAKKAYHSALKSDQTEMAKMVAAKTDDATPLAAKPAKPATLPKTEKPKIEPVSGENQNPDTTANTEENGGASGETEKLPANTETAGDAGSDTEKKTEVNP